MSTVWQIKKWIRAIENSTLSDVLNRERMHEAARLYCMEKKEKA